MMTEIAIYNYILVSTVIRMCFYTVFINFITIIYNGILTYPVVISVISPEVMDQVEDEANAASFTCQTTGEPVPTISWYLNGAPVSNVTDVDKYNIVQMEVNSTTISNTLTIMNVESSDVGTYTCHATNIISTEISSATLTVNGEF